MKQYFLNLTMAVDQFISTVLGGHPDDTVSQRLGRAMTDNPNFVVRTSTATIDWLAFVIAGEEHHCASSLHGKTHAKEIWNWGGSRSQIQVDDGDSYF